MASAVTSIYNNVISAASAGFAPTNSADVSAIASAYQVVSATATQLYAGTAYVTSVNDNPLSAARAGNAANAVLATSAWYDGTGRLISSLPDSAAVSAIASSYAESAASSKQDTLTFGYNTADQISSIDGSALGGMDEAAVSGIASAYAESAASSKQDTLTFGYNAEDKISSINGSSLAGEGGGGGLVTAIGTSESGITSINNSGLVDTAALRSADYSSLYVQEPLYISASGDSSYIGISGDVGGVDSATCSAIASSYAESAVSSYVPYSSLEYNTASAISGINGSALAAGSTYSAGEGIDITDDVISVETPVDIVAGPGIVIDNPDGNTLRVSTEADAETVLYSGNAAISNFPITLSEAPANFETVKIYFQPWSDIKTVLEFMGSADRYCLLSSWADGSGNAFYFNQMLLLNGLQVSFVKGEYVRFGDTVRNTQTSNFYVFKVVGIHRIANN